MSLIRSSTLLLLAGLAGAAEPVRVALEPGECPTRSSCFLPAEKGAAGTPFADGRLLYRIQDGALLLDRNRDGVLDGRDRPALRKGQRATLPLVLGARTLRYPLQVQWLADKYASLTSPFALLGTHDSVRLAVLDGDCDGRFTGRHGDGVAVVGADGQPGRPVPLGGLLALGERLVEARLSDEADALLLTPYAGPLGRVAVAGDRGELTLVHEQDRQVLPLAAGSSAPALPGRWRVEDATLHLAGGGMLTDAEGATLTVAEGATLDLRLAPPDRLEAVSTLTAAGAIETTELWMTGPGGLRWQARVMGMQDTAPLIHVRGAGRSVKVGKIEYG